MGRIMTINAAKLAPTQPHLHEDNLDYVNWGYLTNITTLYPFPIKYDQRFDEYLIIDGHHRTAIAWHYGLDLKVFLAERWNDYMPSPDFVDIPSQLLSIMNLNIEQKFYSVFDDRKERFSHNIHKIWDMPVFTCHGSNVNLKRYFNEFSLPSSPPKIY